MSIKPEEHDFIKEVCAEDAGRRLAPRLSDDPAVRLAECRVERNQCDGCQAGIPAETGPYGGIRHRMGKAGGYPDHMSCTAKDYGQVPAFDEAAERVKFEAQLGAEVRHRHEDGEYMSWYVENQWIGWLACARQKAEGGK